MARHRARLETSAGGVVMHRRNGEPIYLLIRDSYGNWGFPKGHLERISLKRPTLADVFAKLTGARLDTELAEAA